MVNFCKTLIIFLIVCNQFYYAKNSRKLECFDESTCEITNTEKYQNSYRTLKAIDINKNSLKEFYEWSHMDFQKFDHNQKPLVLETGEFYIGNKKHVKARREKGTYVKFIIDLNENQILVPNTAFPCVEDNSCFKNGPAKTCTYIKNYAYGSDCQNAKTILRTNKATKIPEDMTQESYLNFKTFNLKDSSGTTWPLGNVGVLGLGKNSPFWDYLQSFKHADNMYEFLLGLSYHMRSEEQQYFDNENLDQKYYNDFYKNSLLVVNGKLNHDLPTAFIDPIEGQAGEKNWWNFQDLELSFDEIQHIIIEKGSKVNIVNNGKFLFALKKDQYQTLTLAIRKQICPSDKNGQICRKSNVDLSKAPTLALSVHGKNADDEENIDKFTIDYTHYVHFDHKGNVEFAFINLDENTDVCSATADLCLGRILQSKLELVIKVDYETKNFKIGFVENTFDFDAMANFWMYFGIFSGVFVFICLVCYIAFKMTKSVYEKNMKQPQDWNEKIPEK